MLYILGSLYIVALAILLFAPGGNLLDRLRVLGSAICAQQPTHTFSPGGQRLPLCARDTGIYLGLMTSVIALLWRGRGRVQGLPTGWIMVLLLGGIGVMGIDGVNSLLLDLHLPHPYQPNNLLRLATGLLTGTAMAAFLVPVANGILWKQEDARAVYPSLASLGRMIPILLVVFVATASQWGVLLYPIAIISMTGVGLALTLINLTFILAITNLVNRFKSVSHALPIVTFAVSLAVGELIGLAYVNHALRLLV
jgi:uncharacterized membrane protein